MFQQTKGRVGHLVFPIGPKKNTNLVELASCHVFVEFCSAVSLEKWKMFQIIRGRAGILFFRSARKTQTWKRTLRSCFLSSFFESHSEVLEEKKKWKKLKMDGRRTCHHNSALQSSAQVH